MLQLLLTVSAGLAGFFLARSFVRNRLRFVDAIHSGLAPLVAGTLAFAFAWPLALLPMSSAVNRCSTASDKRHLSSVPSLRRQTSSSCLAT